jgi:hypothetical protein
LIDEHPIADTEIGRGNCPYVTPQEATTEIRPLADSDLSSGIKPGQETINFDPTGVDPAETEPARTDRRPDARI